MREDKQRQWIVLTKNNARRFDRILKKLIMKNKILGDNK
jgi:hypothetical protein